MRHAISKKCNKWIIYNDIISVNNIKLYHKKKSSKASVSGEPGVVRRWGCFSIIWGNQDKSQKKLRFQQILKNQVDQGDFRVEEGADFREREEQEQIGKNIPWESSDREGREGREWQRKSGRWGRASTGALASTNWNVLTISNNIRSRYDIHCKLDSTLPRRKKVPLISDLTPTNFLTLLP